MAKNFVDLNVNPCNMCMPMGASMAFAGIDKCMTILHGSQGCATYIRRHMATHYNEPVDIASSSLTEEGTVFGGEANLLKGLKNSIELYHPEVIGVATTCLAETIGEDVAAIVQKFREQNPDAGVKIINASTAGYGGTQFEGYMRTLRAVVSQVEMKPEKNNKINVITPLLSPADTRWLKELLAGLGLQFILLADNSETLDGGVTETYSRLKSGGTTLEDIAEMGGARVTLEFSEFTRREDSPGAYLEEYYGVSLVRLPLPTGLRATDRLIGELTRLGGTVPEELAKERARYLDAMIDGHKHLAETRAAVFGEPDFVKSMAALCCENGIVPVLCATGSVCRDLEGAVSEDIKACADRYFVEETLVRNDCDFAEIDTLCERLGVNLLIGSSDARRIAARRDIDLLRCAFPIHDFVGGQRVRTLGYDGSLSILDQCANFRIGREEAGFRQDAYDKYYDGEKEEQPAAAEEPSPVKTVAERTAAHPCFNGCAQSCARIHLPVAPKCNIQCNYCVRKFDCVNESRPGVTTRILSPEEALQKYLLVKKQVPNLTVVGIAGPGDSLANWPETRKTLELIRREDPEVTFCLSTNGLMLPLYARELYELGVTHVTVTMNAVDPAVGGRIYRFVDYMGTRFRGEAGASVLLANQMTGIRMLADLGIVVKVNIVTLKTVNDEHVRQVTKKAKELGAYITNIMPHILVEGSDFENLPTLSNKELIALRKECGEDILQMHHCRQCRADAVGTLGHDLSLLFDKETEKAKPPPAERKKCAVASESGVFVDKHFGQAEEFYIYESDGREVRLLEKRKVKQYCSGAEHCGEIERAPAIRAVSDCDFVLAMRIGDQPTQTLNGMGIKAMTVFDGVEKAVLSAVNS